MGVLALFDIHANVEALAAVLADPRAADPDVVVVGGDAIPGPFARETLARLDRLAGPLRWIRGNGEREVAETAAAAQPVDETIDRTSWITAATIGDERARPRCPATDGRARRRLLLPREPAPRRRDADSPLGRRALRRCPRGGDGSTGSGRPHAPAGRPHATCGSSTRGASGWPDERSVGAALIEPFEAIVINRLFEARAS